MINMRPAIEAEVSLLQAMDLATSDLFVKWGHPEAADFESIPAKVALQAIDERRLWVAVTADQPTIVVGWVQLTRIDGELCVGQITVEPDSQQRGIGSAMMHWLIGRAIADDEASIVLNTQTDVPWNQPWYEKLGFVVVAPADWSPALAAVASEQSAIGLDWSTRTHMRLDLTNRR